MRTFVEIVDGGSLTAAAEKLDRSQPTVVRTLAALEEHLGVLLLRRTTRRMSLTPEGEDYLERCRLILADVEEAERAASREDAEPSGNVRMTAPLEFGRLHVAPVITAFLWRHDQVRVDLLLLDRNVDLIEEGLDLAVRIGPLTDSSMIAIGLGHVRRVLVASDALLQQTGVPEHPDALRTMPCIRQQNLPRVETAWPFVEDGEEFTVPVDGRFGCNQIAAAVSACVNGMGFGRFLSYQVQDLIGEGRLRPVLEEYEPEPWPVSLVYPGGRLVSSRVRALIDWIREAMPRRGALVSSRR